MFAPVAPSMIPGVIVINIFLFISTVALLSVAGRVAYLAIQRLVSSEPQPTPRAFVFFGSQLGYYAACLLIANFINCVAGLLGLPWLLDKGITEGLLCTTQAGLMQFGNISNGYFTAAIAVHSFNSLVLKRRQSAIMCALYITFGWLGAAAISIAPQLTLNPQPYGISWLSCAVKQDQPFLAFMLHLLPIFVASLVSALLYSLVFLALRGTLRVKGGVRLQLNPEKRFYQAGEEYQAFVAALARTMLWLPVAYVVLLVPYSVTRLLMASQNPVITIPFPVVVISYCFWFSLGAVNVFILYKTFCILGPAIDGKITSTKDVESFAATKNPQWSMVNPTSVQPPVWRAEKISSPTKREMIGRPVLKPLVLSPAHERSASMTSVESGSSSRGLLASFPTPSISSPAMARVLGSPHSRHGSMDRVLSPSQTGVAPSPRTRQVSWDRVVSPSNRRGSSILSPHSRQPSLDHLGPGLPAAPRPFWSPPARIVPPARNSSLPSDAEDLDIAGWLEQHVQDRGPQVAARLSAVTEATDYHPPATASTMMFSVPEPSPLAPIPSVPVPLLDPAPRPRRQQGQW